MPDEARLRRRQPSPPEARWSAMSAREWKPGDVAIVVQSGEERVALRGKYEWSDQDGDSWTDEEVGRYGQRALVVSSSNYLFIQSDGRDATVWVERDDHPEPKPLLTEHQAGPVLWAHLKATLPTRDEPQPEPLDPGVRVREAHGREWARVNDRWTCGTGQSAAWTELQRIHGPLTIITPAPEPTPDERPDGQPHPIEWSQPCMDRGPRIGEDGTRCKRAAGHDGEHRTATTDGFGDVRWRQW